MIQKILTRILAKRRHITKLIKPDQNGFTPGRQGADNIRRTLNIITCARNGANPSIMLSLDPQKAFDRVKWNFPHFNSLWILFNLYKLGKNNLQKSHITDQS